MSTFYVSDGGSLETLFLESVGLNNLPIADSRAFDSSYSFGKGSPCLEESSCAMLSLRAVGFFVFLVAPPDRITQKSSMRKWSNSRGEGTLFSIDLLDEEGSEIKGTFFKAEAERWFDELQEGQVYRISGGKIKVRIVGLPLYRVTINAVKTHRASFVYY